MSLNWKLVFFRIIAVGVFSFPRDFRSQPYNYKYISHCTSNRKQNLQCMEENNRLILETLHSNHPSLTIDDIRRFLIARNWNLESASEMLDNAQAWRELNIPVDGEFVESVLKLNCFFIHGNDLDGSPVVYFRWGIYDSEVASSEEYFLVIAHILEFILKSSSSSKVTIFVDLNIVDGGVNGYADMSFLKYIIKMSSDIYPERLKHLILYPMPWYGMTVWNCLKYFVDHRSQEKLVFVPFNPQSTELPVEITSLISPDEIPVLFGGRYTGKMLDIRDTFQ